MSSFTKPTKSIGIDIGTSSVKAVQMAPSGKGYKVEYVGRAPVDRNQLNVDPVTAYANAVRQSLGGMNLGQGLLVGALPGQTVVIRYPRLADMPEEEFDQAVENEAGQNIPYDLSEVFLDWTRVETIQDDDEKQHKILLVAAKHEVIESRVQIAEAGEFQFGVLTVDSLALADAAEACGFLHEDESVALINVGASSASIHFMRDGYSNFIRDVSWGAREIIQAVAKGRRCDFDEAEQILMRADAELAANAPEAPAESVPVEDLIEPQGETSTAASLLDPLDDELEGFESEQQTAAQESSMGLSDYRGGEMSLAEILQTPVSRLVSEIRRSFDYYEHQLYERPVDRIIMSGGVAQLNLLRDAFVEELGVEDVEVANPAQGQLHVGGGYHVEPLQEHPAQFMVAVGLAARGVADL